MRLTIETLVRADMDQVWKAWNTPDDIMRWNAAQDDWHTTASSVDLREGGKFRSRMEAKDGAAGFDFEGVYTRVVPGQLIEYEMGDGRKVRIEFRSQPHGVAIKETFDAETLHPPEYQQQGWQSILDNFARYVEAQAVAPHR